VAQRKAKRGNGIRTCPRTKEFQQKRNYRMLPKFNVSIMMNWGTLPRTMKR
jgi:hypothetical protein